MAMGGGMNQDFGGGNSNSGFGMGGGLNNIQQNNNMIGNTMGGTGNYANPFQQNMQQNLYNDNYGTQGTQSNTGIGGTGYNQPFNAYNQTGKYDQIMQKIGEAIRKSGNIRSLNEYFYTFDCYQGRLLEGWELSVMFPNLNGHDEEDAIVQKLGDHRFNQGKIDFSNFIQELSKNYVPGITLQMLQKTSIYQDKIRNIQVSLSRVEQIAKAVLASDQQNSYKSSFEKLIFRKNFITVDEFAQMLSVTGNFVDKQELNQLFNYLAIDNFQQVSKIQFVQGFRHILPENQANLIQNSVQDRSQLSVAQTKYLREIQEYIASYSLKLSDVVKEIGVSSTSTHINRAQIDALGRHCRVSAPLDELQMNELIMKMEDKTMINHILISDLEQKLTSFGFVSEKRMQVNTQKDNKLQVIKQYMERNQVKDLDELFINIQLEGLDKLVEKSEFLMLLTSSKINILPAEADLLAVLYETSLNSGKINISKIKQDLSQNNSGEMALEKATEIANQVFDQLKKFLSRNEINIVDVLLDADIDDGYLDREELKFAFERMGIAQLTTEQIEAMYVIFDPRKTNKIDQKQFLDKFFDYANKSMIKEPTHKFFSVYEKIRKYLKQKKHFSISTIFLDDNTRHKKEVEIETTDFLNFLKSIVLVTELQNRLTEQSFTLSLLNTNTSRIDYYKFADFVGYEYPQRNAALGNTKAFGDSQGFGKGTFKFELRRHFYRTLLKNLTSRDASHNIIFNSQMDRLDFNLKEIDTNLQNVIHINSFGNILIRHCPTLSSQPDVIELIARDFVNANAPNMIYHIEFVDKVRYEFKKLSFLMKVYRNFFETLEFRAITDLYTLFQPFDIRKDKKFDSTQLVEILSKRGITVQADVELKYMFDEYDAENSGFVKYSDIEKDYRELTEEIRLRGGSGGANLPQILQTIKRYMDLTGQTLRQIFNKTKVGDLDQINQYQFIKIINQMGSETRNQIQEASIHKFMLELTTKDHNQVSFLELVKLFNSHFNIKDDDDRSFMPFYIDKLQWYIVKVALDKKSIGFKLEEHFGFPSSMYSQFLMDLKKDPLNCPKESTQQVIDEMVRKYQEGNYINTQQFIVDLQEKMFKQEQKNQIIFDIRKQILLKNLKIEEIFYKAIPEIQKFKIVYLSPEEFQSVFLFVEYKISLDRVAKMLSNFFQPDEHGKYSYLEFIQEFKAAERTNQQFKGRRLFQSTDEILKRIATCIEQRNLRSFGGLLADQDLHNNLAIEKDSFYRVLDSMQLGLGEGDIQELMRVYHKKDIESRNGQTGVKVDIVRFKDDLNSYIIHPDLKVVLKSILHDVVNERIVEPIIELSPRSSNKKTALEQAAHQKYSNLVKDLLCGLFVRGYQDSVEWFTKFSSFVKGSLTSKEFQSGCESLDLTYDDPSQKQGYYDHLLQRQEVYLGYKSQVLLIEQLQNILQKDCPFNREQMIETLLYDVAEHLSEAMTPVKEAFNMFDTMGTGLVFRSDFISIILDNYLHLSRILTINRKILLTQRYAPTEAVVQMGYGLFIDDLQRMQFEHPGKVKVLMTQFEVDQQKMQNQAKEKHEQELNEQEQRYIQQSRIPDPVAQSKKNTVCTMNTVTQQFKIQIPSFQFDDIMLETFRRGVAVEVYFKKFSKFYKGMHVLDKNEFYQAVASLSVKWAEQQKLSEMFDAIDQAVHGNYSRSLRIEDIGEAVIQNALYTVEDYQAKTLEAIYQGLKAKQMLTKLRDLFNFFNTRRDNTCSAQDFKSILLEKIDLSKLVNESQLDLLVLRYKAMQDGSRIQFTPFIRDMEYCDKGIKPSLIWAIELAEDITKSLLVQNYASPEQLFNKFSKVQGMILFDEFRRAMDELQISIYHDDQAQKDFFHHIEMQEHKGTLQTAQQTDYSKVGMVQLCNTIKSLCQKSLGQIYSEILEQIYVESKKINLTITVYTIFTEYDLQKTGHVHFSDFKYALEQKLNANNLKPLDIQVLAKRYKSNQRGISDDMVQYEKFFQDYERIEKLGLKAGFDPLRQKQEQTMLQQQQQQKQGGQADMPPEVKKIYNNVVTYTKKMSLIEKLCDQLATRDTIHKGMLAEGAIQEVFKVLQMPLNKKQMNFVIYPLPFDTEGNFNYLYMIELLYGKTQSQLVQQKYKLQGFTTDNSQTARTQQLDMRKFDMSIRFKDSIELRFQALQNISHQLSKGSYLLREQEFYSAFKKAGLLLLSQDLDLLQQTFRAFRNAHTSALDFRQFIKQFEISDTSSVLLLEIQKEIQVKNIKIEDILATYGEFMSFEEFQKAIEIAKIKINAFNENEIKNLFDQIAERKDKLEKSNLIRTIKNEIESQEQEWLPYIVNELVYFICNNNIDIFKTVNPQAKKLTIQQFQTLLQQIRYIPSNPKELPALMTFFALPGDNAFISIEKLVYQIRKIMPSYGAQAQKQGQLSQQQQQKPQNQSHQQQPLSKQISLFTNKVKTILSKINETLKRNGISNQQLYQSMDMNKNGQIEKSEFVVYFSKDLQVKQVALSDLELLYDSLDMNKDGILSVNELCLCLEGIQISNEQRMKSFDIDLEKEMIKQINDLFNFFDKNQDNIITLDELTYALRSVNQNISIKEAQQMMAQADTNKNNTIDRQEFVNLMLPKFKEEIIGYEQNLDDLRRLFKESDTDHSNYLSKNELKNALIKLNILLTDVQLDDLMRELDLDDNQHIDIDEFMAFLSIADQIKFKNPSAKTNIIKIRFARKLHAIDFYNCFKNLPQFFLPSFTTDVFEKRNLFTPSHGLFPEFDSKSMTYKDLQKLEEIHQANPGTMQTTSTSNAPYKKYIDLHSPHLGCEIQLEECSGVPLPKKEDFDWSKISHREVRAVLFDFRTCEYVSNSFIIPAMWRPEYEGKWLFNTNESLNQAKNFLLRSDLLRQPDSLRDVHLLFELVLYTKTQEVMQQVTCVWGSIPATQLDKLAKHKVTLRGGSPHLELKIDQSEVHQEKKGFSFLKKLAASVDEPMIIMNVKPFLKFQEQTQYYLSMLPSTCLINKRLLSFAAAFRIYCQRKLSLAQQLMVAPQGNFVIAQFKKIFDNPDVNFILGECWDSEVNVKLNQTNPSQHQANLETCIKKMEEFMTKLYSIIYSTEFGFDHVFPTRSSSIESEQFHQREMLIKSSLLPGKFKVVNDMNKKKKPQQAQNQKENVNNNNQPIILNDEYKPFNISEMEINITGLDAYESKQDEMLKMYKQMGLIY